MGNKGDKERITLDELSRLYRKEEEEEERKQEADTKMNRLSMMSCEEHGGELDLEEGADYEEERPSPEVRIKRPAANTNIIEVRYRERNPPRGTGRQHGGVVEQQRRKSRHVNRLQITNV